MEPAVEFSISSLLRMAFIWELIWTACYVIGSLAVGAFLYDNFKSLVRIIKAVLEPFFQPQLPQTLVDKFGKWAVITGATDGIGKEYAKELARQGLNLVLISRTKEKLQAVAFEIEAEHKVKTKTIAIDFAEGRKVYAEIEKELQGIQVGILVNNVGKMYDYPDTLDKVSEDVLWDMININIGAVTMLTRQILPQMKAAGKGAIVNIGSGSELQPIPLMTVYAASKKYISFFTQALEQELTRFNITVQLVMPLFVVTKMNQYSNTVMQGGFLVPNARTFARSAVFTLGKTSRTNGFWTHSLQYLFMKLAPEHIRTLCSHHITNKLRLEYLSEQGKNKVS